MSSLRIPLRCVDRVRVDPRVCRKEQTPGTGVVRREGGRKRRDDHAIIDDRLHKSLRAPTPRALGRQRGKTKMRISELSLRYGFALLMLAAGLATMMIPVLRAGSGTLVVLIAYFVVLLAAW